MSRFTGFSEKSFFKKKRCKIWAKCGQWCYRFKFLEGIRLHWLFHTDFGEIRFLKRRETYQFKFFIFGNVKKVFRRFAFIQANIFFLNKMKKDFNKNPYFMCQILTSECYTHPPTRVNLTHTLGRLDMCLRLKTFVFPINSRETQKRRRLHNKCCNLSCNVHIISFVQSVASHSSMHVKTFP